MSTSLNVKAGALNSVIFSSDAQAASKKLNEWMMEHSQVTIVSIDMSSSHGSLGNVITILVTYIRPD